MGDISNKSLAALLVVAIVVSVAGTWMVVNKAPGLKQVTGKYDATLAIEIQANTAAEFTDATISVAAYVNTTEDACAGETETPTATGCAGLSGGNDKLVLKNTGTTVIDCTEVSDVNASTYTGFTVLQRKTTCSTGTGSGWNNLTTDEKDFCLSLDQNGEAYEYVKWSFPDTAAADTASFTNTVTCGAA